ncbi:diguanylate cyclase [Isosphaeraceae bacterium EP7]
MKILIADDDPVTRLALKRALADSGYRVTSADRGDLAWRMVLDDPEISVVISDWMMPGLDGLDLCRNIRGLPDRPYIYVILLTARSVREDRLLGLAAGADDFLAKPLDRAELAARLNVASRILSMQTQLRDRSLELESMRAELQRRNELLAELATTDGLTGLYNNRHFREILESSLSLVRRERMPLSLVLLDVDQFKAYNDEFGHPAGDEVLKRVGRILRTGIREYDMAARYGGEEFVLLLPSAPAAAAVRIADRMRLAIAGHPWPLRPVTASFGVATTDEDDCRADDLIATADRALYHSKRNGRNCVTHAGDLRLAAG